MRRNFSFLIIFLVTLGLIAVADASAPEAVANFGDKFYFFKQQALWAVLGLVVFFATSKIHYSFWGKVALPAFGITVLLLIAVLLPGVSSRIYGARRWLNFSFFSFQPAELVKLTLAFYLAKLLAKTTRVLAFLVPILLVCGLVMLQPDLGTTLVIATVAFSQVFIAGVNFFYLTGLGILGGIAGLGLILTSVYRKARLLTFLQVAEDPLGRDYHIRQVLFALGSGGILGVGLGQSRQKFLFLPQAATDSIFAVIAEEMGFLGAMVLIILFVLFIIYGLRIAKSSPDKFATILATGLTIWIGSQAIINIGSMVALVPLTGVPLPFFSYGGSALVTELFAAGVIANIAKYGQKTRN